MNRWQATFDRLDALSRIRALTDSESALLEHAIKQIDGAPRPATRAGAWADHDVARFCQLVTEGCSIREAGRRIGKTGSAAVAKWKRLREIAA
jgi:hypothetical protein